MDKLDFVDNSDAIAIELRRSYCIQGLAETLLHVLLKANLDEADTRAAFEQAIDRLFSKS